MIPLFNLFPAFLNQLGPMELLIIAFVVLLLFGAKRLPELFRSMGQSLGEFKKATREVEDEVRNAMDTESGPPQKTPSPASSNQNSTHDKPDEKEHPESKSQGEAETVKSRQDSL